MGLREQTELRSVYCLAEHRSVLFGMPGQGAKFGPTHTDELITTSD